MVLTGGAHVFGQVRDAGRSGVGGGELKVTAFGNGQAFDVAAFRTDSQGGFDLDFMPRVGDGFTLTAQHPVTRDLATITARVQANGQQLLLNPTFLGRGTVRGRLIAPGGATVGNTPIALIPGSVLGLRGFGSHECARRIHVHRRAGRRVRLDGRRAAGSFGQATGVIARATWSVRISCSSRNRWPPAGGRRVFLSDGATPRPASRCPSASRRDDARSPPSIRRPPMPRDRFAFARSLPPGT
jgi:hypothetical protein